MNPRLNSMLSSQNPIVQVCAFLVAGLLLVGAFVIGSIVLVVLLGAGVILAIGVWLRMLWIRHKLKRAGADAPFGRPKGDLSGADAQRKQAAGRVIEVEYTVVEKGDSGNKGD